MTWNELLEKIREGLGESNAHLRALGNMVVAVGKDDGGLSGNQSGAMITLLILAVSDIHSAVAHVSLGLDAVVEALREADKSQEVKRD